ncbi:PP2C family serine/threonine-protein phosphatase [Demequina sp. NBRC 110056]|uniref:PP2C family protein-serine/threonine phosphatase n=1 Tax=Demequina sp. NBRC 110056 TaxID=1570345 RepID=UPI000A0228FD|nr:protein phosphatase 2C domain-containing protein [Demequina sp. NBRC 110056]
MTHWSAGAGHTDIGPRPQNQDAFLSEGGVHVVADGMGGHAGGAEAAQAVVEAFRPLVGHDPVTPADVAGAVARARDLVDEVALQHGGYSGSTLTGALAVEHDGDPWWLIVNVGDSRVYAIDGVAAHQITVDHSHVQELVDAGRLTPEQAQWHPDRNLVTRAIGDGRDGFDGWLVRARPGLRLVLASDGLMKSVPDASIGEIAGRSGRPLEAAQVLVDHAIAEGTNDNVTVVVVDTLDASTASESSGEPWVVWGEFLGDGDDSTTVERTGA